MCQNETFLRFRSLIHLSGLSRCSKMFGFFEKAINDLSEIVAPIGASNQLFLAIQHGKNDECLMLINSACKDFDVRTNADCGYGALHVACKYNNREMVDEITRRGVSVEFLDKSGNTPLHYASKGGYLDLVKYLVDAGASVLRKNNQNQRAYDVAESHVIRQFLLPLQFKAEAEEQNNTARGAGPNYDPYMYVSGIETQGGPVNGDPEQRAAMAAAAAAAQPPPIMAAPPMTGAAANSSNPYAAGASTLQHPSYAAYPGFSDPTQQSNPAPAAAPVPTRVPAAGVVPQPSATPEAQAPPPAAPAATTSPKVQPPVVNVGNFAAGSGAQPVSAEAKSTITSPPVAAAPVPTPAPAPAPAAAVTQPPSVAGPPVSSVYVSSSPLKPVAAATLPPPAAGALAAPAMEPAPAAPSSSQVAAPAPAPAAAPASAHKPLAFTPDGFHSSSNDPVLQQRYGHHKLVKNIAPPPIFGAPPAPGAPGVGAPPMMGGPPPMMGGPPPMMGAPPAPAATSYSMPPPPPAISLSAAGPPPSVGGIAAPSAPGTAKPFSVPEPAPAAPAVGVPPMMAPPRTVVNSATASTGPAKPVVNTIFSPNDEAVSLSSSSSSVM